MKVASYKTLTSSGAVLAEEGYLIAVVLTGGSDAATVTLYDNASAASGNVICKLGAAAGASASFAPGAAVKVANGIYAALSGTGPSVSVIYAP